MKARIYITLALALIVCALFGLSFHLSFDQSSAQLTTATVYFENPAEPKSAVFILEVANTNAMRSRGLMFRKNLEPNKGMLFIFPYEREQIFWMKNTYLSLDMVFLDHALTVVGLLESVPPLNEQPRKVERPSKYVIELAAGAARKNGVALGSRAVISAPLPQSVD